VSSLLRGLPSVDRLAAELSDTPEGVAVAAARQVIDEVRAEVLSGAIDALPAMVPLARQRARLLGDGRLQRVINATGVVVHTNLGRSAWSSSARQAALRVMGGCDLELRLGDGQRGGRLDGLRAQLRALTGAEDALVVNNAAAAVLLALTALARGREVVVSRGELVEIGGSFRVPDVIASGGAVLREVGTTNRTRAGDYEAAIGEHTAVLLKVHPSNFRQIGFTEEAPREALAEVARRHGLPLLEDLGSGALRAQHGEPAVREVVGAGVDLVMFSADKLLGGPQGGVVVGRSDLVATLRAHPLYRALRVDKVTLAALEATLGDHLAGRATPTGERLALSADALRPRAEAWARAWSAEVVAVSDVPGGGASPGVVLPSVAVRVEVPRAHAVAQALRQAEVPVLVRVADEAVWVHPRAVDPSDDERVRDEVAAAIGLR
jgi:L-seryl-tRNA(Ser) seleniumtransferase